MIDHVDAINDTTRAVVKATAPVSECGLLDRRHLHQTLVIGASNPFAASPAKLGGGLSEADEPVAPFLPLPHERSSISRGFPSTVTHQYADL